MIHVYDSNRFFFYKEENYFYSYSQLGSFKIVLYCIQHMLFSVLGSIFFFRKKNAKQNFFSKSSSRLLRSIGSLSTDILNGIIIKFGPKGKRTRVTYSNSLFFFKLGYSSRVPYLLPMNIVSSAKDKKTLFYNLGSINRNSITNSISHISSFRLIDPYNFGGLMLRDGFFKYSNWSSKLV